jgi:hypothetical protein
MRYLKKHINHVITSITVAISIDGYRRVLNSEVNDRFTNDLLQETIRKSTEIINKLDEQNINNVEIESKLGKVKNYLDEIENKTKIISDIGNNNLKNETTKDLIIENNNILKESVFKANGIIDEIFKKISGSNDYNNNFITDIFTN